MKIFSCLVLSAAILLSSCQSGKARPESEATNLNLGNKVVTLETLSTLIPEKVLNFEDTYGRGRQSVIGFPLHLVLDSYMGQSWRELDGILFTAFDGYKVDVPVSKILRYRPLLAFRYADKSRAFTVQKSEKQKTEIELGPYYLVWDNLANPHLIRESNYEWPYGIVRIDAIRYATQYASLFPFKDSSSQLKAGFAEYKKTCLPCHALNNEGGLKAAQLYPYPPVVEMGEKKFIDWVLSPEKMKPGTTMPALNPYLDEKDRKRIAAQMYAYLSALHKKK